MKMLISVITLTGLLILSLISNIVFWDFWNQEKKEVQALEKRIEKMEKEKTALKSNNENEIVTFSEEFVKHMFSYDSKKGNEKSRNTLKKLTIGKASTKLFGKGEKTENEQFHKSEDNLISSVIILKTNYIKKSSDKAESVIEFEQTMKNKMMKQKMIYEIRLQLRYEGSGWKVEDYEIKQKI
jgi:hypothetical protein